MQAELRQDRGALHWIRGELDQTLRDARAALEDHVEGQADRLQACVDLLHHVHGALDMVQVYGAAMLADEMEQLASSLFHGQVKRPDAAAEALMLGMVQLPAYLERVENGGADIPLALLPLMNDLRSAREAPLVSETSLFAPKLNAVIAAETVRPGSGNRDLPNLIHLRRSHFHRGLLNWIRGQDVPASLRQMRDVLDELHDAAGTARMRRLLEAARALASALMDEQEAPALAVKPLFGKVDRVFKQVIDQGEESAMLDFPADLLKNMLYYVARSSSDDPAVRAVRHATDLVNGFADQQPEGPALASLGAPDRELFHAVGEALSQDLRDVKDRFDLYLRSDRSQLERLTGLSQPIQRIADTLGMVGRGELRSRLKHRCEELQAADQSGESPSEERLMVLAEDLLFVESSLVGLASGEASSGGDGGPAEAGAAQSLSAGELQQHQRVAIDEGLIELAKTKDDILEYLEKPEHPELLESVPPRLHMVSGVLRMLGLPEAANLLKQLGPYVAGLSTGQVGVPDAVHRDALADVVISAELYMQSAIEPGTDRAKLLGYAEAALERLGLREPVTAPHAKAGTPRPETVETPETPESPAMADAADASATGEPAPEVPVAEASPQDAQSSTAPMQPETRTETEIAGPAVAAAETETEAEAEVAEAAPVITAQAPGAEPEPEHVAQAAGATAPQDTGVDEVDSEILEVFNEEAQEELEVIRSCYPKWRDNPEERESLQTTRRSFHTLKGSGRIVGASNIGEFSWAIENLLNRVIDGTIALSPDLQQLMDEVLAVLPVLVEECARPGAPGTDVSALAERAFALASGEAPPTPAAAPAEEAAAAPAETVSSDAAVAETAGDAQPADAAPAVDGEVAPSAEPEPVEVAEVAAVADEAAHGPAVIDTHDEVPDESILTAAEVADSEFSEFDAVAMSAVDTSLNAVFLNEVEGHLNVLADFIQRCRGQGDGCVVDEGVRRAMHTLRGSAHTAGAEPLARLAGALEAYAETMHRQHRQVDAPVVDMLERSHRTLVDMAASFDDPHRELPPWEALCEEVSGRTADLQHEATVPQDGIEAEGGFDADSASEAEIGPGFETAPRAEAGAAPPSGGLDEAVDPELLEVFLDEAKELLEALEAELGEWEEAVGDRRPVAQLQRTLHTMKGGARLAGVAAVGDLSHALESVFESVVERRIDDSGRLKGLVRHATDVLAQDVDKLVRGSMPAMHAAMIERLEAAAHGRPWDDIAADEAVVEPVGSPAPADPWQAEAESWLATDLVDAGTETTVDLDGDSELLDDSQLMTDSELLRDSSLLSDDAASADAVPAGAVAAAASTVVQFPGAAQVVEGDGFVPRRPLPEAPPAPSAGGERVRVPSEMLDQMVNNAGEVSIYRARIEQQNSSFGFNLEELGQTIDRLRGQLRSLELETEAQIRSRHEREGETLTDFDPLEMDRYSTIQQLSRALSETVEDLSNLGHTLSDLSRDTDTLLLQQARVTTDLQDSLLRTRMVKFSSRVPRLERVVRQTSHSVGKQAGLEVVGGEEDMDRAILERMMGPLEHLLRNAVSHGIEDADTRQAKGKAAQGRITLRLAREGTDVVLSLSDDGAGLDRERIRAKAVERGLLEPDAVLEDEELYQLILQPGFSTAQELSQVSGRGVGMDVVLTEVKQLGGTLQIDSQPGQGTRFTVRLPFTLAITDALLVTLGDDIYAVPHSSMDGVVRVPVDELRAIYAGERESFAYGGREYAVRYLGGMLGAQAPHLAEGTRWLPLLLVRSGENRVAVQVDGLLGNRQIVVKSIGAQLSGVRWFTGGTILADGQIALILDINSLIRIDGAQQATTRIEVAEPVNKGVSVMVVDDSITVRKVTSRLLERHNMQVLTAKDGVDAVTVLQEHHPDVVLLDIEMPRMDGYELARHMRSTPELSDIPIIMITSRTGDKHRNRAIELGVKRYLGKPYQEAELLENIYTVLADASL